MISPALSRRRNGTVIVRRDDPAGSGGRPRSRRGRRRIIRMPTKTGAIATAVLLFATVAWLAVFGYLLSLVH